ncbi:methyltransferase domain-containing protein [Terrimicrobium sacchariphilum]|uniref:Methyltransferase domain-containing protein n=1 Tax=Terrimicrobium sacchariphilum TaxID=690879 RepID=A0A146G4I8_TERSA|nr:class I SAM-dependent methyltransferase [Terrimicrobium sacchariphilum]GAT31748.1 methyltransferase domain-containing protein [Terrimicrobium sacchariphilum]
MKDLIVNLCPHGLLQWLRIQRSKRWIDRARSLHTERYQRINDESIINAQNSNHIRGDDWHATTQFLADLGLPKDQIIEGSISETSLKFISTVLRQTLNNNLPLLGLHIGNFVGVSLAHITASAVQIHPDSLVIAIDPNLTHRGIKNPQNYVLQLLQACDLSNKVLPLAAYSGEKSISNDGFVFGNYDPTTHFQLEAASSNAIQNLTKLFTSKCDFVLMDGNHQADYLVKEIHNVKPLLKPGGLVILDDINMVWEEIRSIFLNISSLGLAPLADDGRVGIAIASDKAQ